MNTTFLKVFFLLSVLLLSFAIVAQSTGDGGQQQPGQVIATTLFSDGSTNTWTQADLLAALQLINRKYHRDCERADGRKAWHGKMRETVTTNEVGELVKQEIHEDGQTFTFTSRYVTAAAAVSNANFRLTTTMTRGVPSELAKARLRRAREKNTVSNVTVSVEATAR